MKTELARQPTILVSTQLVERVVSGLLYLTAITIMVVFGVMAVDRSAVSRFTNDYLPAWAVAVARFEARQGVWPPNSGGDHESYMAELVSRMKKTGVAVPVSNMEKSWHYKIALLGRKSENVFVLPTPGLIYLFGLSSKSAAGLDEAIDGRPDPAGGKVLIQRGRNERQVVVKWLL